MGFAFKMDLTGTMASTLGVINPQLVQMDKRLSTATIQTHKFDAAIEGVGKTGGVLKTIDLVGLFNSIAGAISGVISKTIDMGKWFLKTAAGAQDLSLATQLQLGPEGAAMLGKLADSFVNTRFDDDIVRQALLPLANAGIRDEETLDAIATAASDISARFNTGEAGFEAATEALGKIALRREVSEKQLQALGVNEQDFLATLSKSLGQSVEATKKAVAAGKLSAPTLLNAALQSIADKQGGSLGVAALAGGRTLGATLARLENLPGNMFKQLADNQGVKGIQNILDGVVDAFMGPAGGRVVATIGKGLDRIFGGFKAENVVAGIEKAIDSVFRFADFVISAVGAIGEWWTMLEPAKEGAGKFDIALIQFGQKISNFVIGIGQNVIANLGPMLSGALRTVGFDAGAALVDGMVNGLMSFGDKLKGGINSVGDSVVGFLRERLDWHSPSGIGIEAGASIPQGMALGMERGTGDVLDASRALSAAALPTALPVGAAGLAAQAAGVTPGGGLSLSVGEVNVYTNATDARGTGDAVRREIVEAFRQIATEVGA